MLNRLIFAPSLAGAAFALAFTAGAVPAPAIAQDAAAEPETRRTYEPINYNVQEDAENILVLDLSNGERVSVRLMPSWAPSHIQRIKTLTRQGFYDGVIFHRVIEGFMAQTGDPTGTGQGGSELPDLKAEFNPMPHLRGTMSMARANDEDSANSQFFLTFAPRFSLDKRYTNLGRVISNMPAVDAINRGEPPADPTRIVQASIASDNVAPPAPGAMTEPAQDVPNLNGTSITPTQLSSPIGE